MITPNMSTPNFKSLRSNSEDSDNGPKSWQTLKIKRQM